MPTARPDAAESRWDGFYRLILRRAYNLAMTGFVMGLLAPCWGFACRLGWADPAVFDQRLGRGPGNRRAVDLLIHAVSAGEMRAARALILQALAIQPGLRIALTT